MDPKRHAWLARRLIAACGGLEACAESCRLKRSRLAEFTDPASEAFMPADVIVDLELFCGEPLYSRAMVEAAAGALARGDLLAEASEAVEEAAALQRFIRVELHPGARLTAAQRRQLRAMADDLEREARKIVELSEGGRQ